MAKETATDQQPPGRTPATPDWHTPDTQGVSQTRGGHCWGMEGSTSSYTVRWRHRAIWKFVTKLAKIFTTWWSVFFFQKPNDVWDLGELGSEAGYEWGEVRNQQAKGSEGVGVACLRLPPFWLLEGYRCAAPALLQTHSAISASSSERCNSK